MQRVFSSLLVINTKIESINNDSLSLIVEGIQFHGGIILSLAVSPWIIFPNSSREKKMTSIIGLKKIDYKRHLLIMTV